MAEAVVADLLLDAVLDQSREGVQRALRRAQYAGDPHEVVRALTGAVLDVVLRDPNQQAELIERLSAENRSLRDRASKAEASNRRLSADVSRLAQRSLQLEREARHEHAERLQLANVRAAAMRAGWSPAEGDVPLAEYVDLLRGDVTALRAEVKAFKKPTTRRRRRG